MLLDGNLNILLLLLEQENFYGKKVIQLMLQKKKLMKWLSKL